MYLDSSHYAQGYHINQELWFYTTSNEAQFIEMGLRNGNAIGGDPCGTCQAYEVFWADWDTSGNEHPHYIANTVPDSTNHSYEFVGSTGTQWNVYYDGNYYGVSTNQTSSVAYEAQTGLEISRGYPSDIGSWSHADTFDDTSLSTQSANGTGWSYWPYINTWIDQPCGSYPQGSCLNGNAPNTSEWLNNKP